MTLSNHLSEAAMRCNANTCGCPTAMALMPIVNLFYSLVALDGSAWLIVPAPDVSTNGQTLTVCSSYPAMDLCIGMGLCTKI